MEHKSDQKDRPAIIRTPDYRLRVFISSTLKELAEEREAARQAILNLRLMPVMFESGARSHPSHELYRAYLSQSHIFVGIYWQSYGWVPEGETISGLDIAGIRERHGIVQRFVPICEVNRKYRGFAQGQYN